MGAYFDFPLFSFISAVFVTKKGSETSRNLDTVLTLHNLLIIRIAFIYSFLVYWYLTLKINCEIILHLAKASGRELLKAFANISLVGYNICPLLIFKSYD